MVEQVSDDARLANMRTMAYLTAKQQLSKQFYAGGCARDYSGCPIEWSASGNTCVPSSSYTGFCGTTSFSSDAQKEEFAWKCGAEWACASSVSGTTQSSSTDSGSGPVGF